MHHNTHPPCVELTAAPSTPAHLSSHLPKLRSACDECGTAKVKCDRARPGCGRCTALALTCVYGPSRKSGKPPRKRLAPGAHLVSPPAKRPCTQPPAEANKGHNPDVSLGMPSSNSGMAGHPGPATNGISLPPADSLNAGLDIGVQDAHFFSSMVLDDWAPFDSLGAGLGISSPSAAPPISTPNASTTHNCPRESYEIFRDLICPTPTLHAPESNSVRVPAQLDDVLRANRSAVDRLGRLLKCPCARSGHRAMVHASIVSRILIWYQQAAGWTGAGLCGTQAVGVAGASECSRRGSSPSSPSSSPSALSDSADANSEIPPSLPQATGFIVEHVPLSFGSFSVEDEDLEAMFRNQLILCELRKMSRVIDMFMEQDSSGPLANSMAGLYEHLGTWLRCEHSRTVEIVKAGLDAFHGDMVS